MKKLSVITACIALALSLGGCSGSSTTEVDYADDEAMQVIASGWQDRSDALEDASAADDNYIDELKQGIQIEIDNDSPLKSRQFEDSKMQEDVLAYLNSLDGQMDVLNSYSATDYEFYEAWNKVYDERSQLLKTFVEDYGMTVSSKYQSILDELLANGTAAENKAAQEEALEGIVSAITWEPSEEYGHYTYTAVVENTSDYNYSNVGLVVGLYDADGVRTETYASANTWKKGDKVKFEVYGNEVSAERIETTVNYYEVDD